MIEASFRWTTTTGTSVPNLVNIPFDNMVGFSEIVTTHISIGSVARHLQLLRMTEPHDWASN